MDHKHLLGLEDLNAEEITAILDTAEAFRGVLDRPIKKVPTLRGKTVANLFFEPSTRTRISFELAEKRRDFAKPPEARPPVAEKEQTDGGESS